MKSIIFVSLLVAAIAIPLAEAQISLPQLINVNGTVSCSANASVSGTTLPPFPNAGVQLQCGGTPIANTTTSGTGTFSFVLNSVNLGLVTSLLTGGCRVVVTTPLATCNVSNILFAAGFTKHHSRTPKYSDSYIANPITSFKAPKHFQPRTSRIRAVH